MTEDEQEAHSAKYCTGLRLLLLASGNWGVFHSGEQGLSELSIVPQLDDSFLRMIAASAQLEQDCRREAERLLELVHNKTEKTVEELGL